MNAEIFNPEVLSWYRIEADRDPDKVFRKKWEKKQKERKGYTKSLGKDTVYKKSG